MKTTLFERVWRFSQEEYVEAFARVTPREIAKEEVATMFAELERDPSQSIGGDDFVFALLSLVSPSCRQRVLEITKWSDNELAAQQALAVKPAAD